MTSQPEFHDSPLAARLPQMVQVTGYDECLQVFRSPVFASVEIDGSVPFIGATVGRIDQEEHAVRRRALNRLTRQEGHRWFREQALQPAIAQVLDEELAKVGQDGVVRSELTTLARRIQVRFAAAIVGLEDVDTSKRVTELIGLVTLIREATSLQFVRGDSSAIVPRALQAKRRFAEDFYQPSRLTHQRIVDAVQSGEIDESQLPHNLMTLMVLGADPRWADPDLAMREAIQMIQGVVETSTAAIVFAFDELEEWWTNHPEDRTLSTDPAFLLAGVQESLRLHTVSPVHMRRALQDVVLASGTRVEAGQIVALLSETANRSETVFGPDADRFDPRRQVPEGVNRFGITFGSGIHMCFGLPLVFGAQGIDGALVHQLRALYDAGARRDPDAPATKRPNLDRDTWDAYPILLRGMSRSA